MYLIPWGRGGWDSFDLVTCIGVPDLSLMSLGQVMSMAKWLPLCIAKQWFPHLWTVSSCLHHVVMRFFRRKTAEPAFVYLWVQKPLEIKNHCSNSCGNTLPWIVSWLQWKLQPNHQFICDFTLAPPPTFCGIHLFGVTVSIKILVVLFLSHFVSFHNLHCDVATSRYNLGFYRLQKGGRSEVIYC